METPQAEKPTRWKGLGTRVLGILPFLGIVFFCVYMGGFWFYALVLLAAIVMLREWDRLTALERGKLLRLLGYPLIITPCASMIWLRSIGNFGTAPLPVEPGQYLIITLIAIIAATDIGAYFTGKRFGTRKLAPSISPNKTWEGLAGGIIFSMLMAAFLMPLPMFARLFTGIVFAVLAQAGDLLESWVKRRAGVKDSGNLIPGHGGLLDRLDGYLFTAPAFALLVYFLY